MGKVAIAVLTILPLLPTLRAAYIYDDTTVIRDNTLLRGWSAIARVWTSPYWPSDGGTQSLGLYRPLQLSLLAFVWNLGGGSARAFHVYALCLALAASLAMWWLLRRGVAGLAALIAALWFATHPLHVEAVASVANTSELVVLLATIGLTRVFWSAREEASWAHALAGAVLAAAALSAKESGLFALPLAAMTAWGWTSQPLPLRDFITHRARALVGGMLGVIAVLVARLVVLGAPISTGSIAAQGLDRLSATARAWAMMSLWPKIAGMVIWPTALAPYYGPTVFPADRIATAAAGVVILVALVALAFRSLRQGDRRMLVGVTWIVLTYLPASNLLAATGQILSDRTLFGATAGAAMIVACLLDTASRTTLRFARLAWIILLAHNLLVGSRYAVAWTTHHALWEHLHDVEPNEHMSYKLLGMDARGRGDYAAAIAQLSRALAMVPTDRQIRFELGQAQYQSHDYEGAATTLQPLLRDADARAEPQFVALYLDALGRARGAAAVASAARRLLHTEADSVARKFLEAATSSSPATR